jgi:Fe-S-cluster containining protein
MKQIAPEKIDHLPGRRILPGETFTFRCGPDRSCFNRCCHNLNLFLYPYDVMRLKTALDMPSDRFLDRYVDVVLRDGNHFPEVLLRMADGPGRPCPFVTDTGCRVYADRPDTCRHFPMEQGLLYDDAGRPSLVHLFRPPAFCRGPAAAEQWTVDTWSQDQDAIESEKMTILWADVRRLFMQDPYGAEGPEGPRGKMAFMATYNLDRFRRFVFESSFLKRYKVKADLLKKIGRDDRSLLLFGLDWVKLFLFALPTKKIRPR